MKDLQAAENTLLTEVSGPRLMENTRAIAQWVRLSGEPDELESFKWVEEKLREYGYSTRLEHHRAYISLPEQATVRVAGHDRVITGISHAFATSTATGGLSATLIDSKRVGENGRESAGQNVAGAIVLVDGMAGGPTVLNWEARGASGQIYIHDDHLHETSISNVWGNPTDQDMALMPTTPSLAIRQADGEWLRTLLAAGPIQVNIQTQVLTEWRPIPLLTAELPSGPTEPYVLLSSHIDSWYYGAMDNGSANATTLEAAKLLGDHATELRRGLRLAFWSGHSHGRFAGSAWYADDQFINLHEQCIAHVFVDSTGGMGATVVTEAPVMPQTKALAAAAVKTVTGEEFEGKRIGRFADQSFYPIGLNSVFGTLSEQDATESGNTISFKTGGRRAGGLGWWWHTPEDTVDKVDEEFLVRDTKIYVSVLHQLLTAPRLPFDYRPAIDEIDQVIRSRISEATSSHLDLGPLLDDLSQTQEAINAFHAALDQGGEGANDIGNEALFKLSRHLVPIAFHETGPFTRDKAEPLVPVPALRDLERLASEGLDTAAAHAIASRLHRAINWIRTELRAATNVAQRATRALGENLVAGKP